MVFTGDGHNRVAKSLITLYNQVVHDFPGRRTGNDGTIGDLAHQARVSDHNPNIHLNGMGIITALDITHDPAHGFDALAFAESLRLEKEPRIKYVIFNGRIFNSKQDPWQWRERHQGKGDHAEHVHISVLDDPAKFDDETPWKYSGSSNTVMGPTAAFPPKLQRGDTGPAVHDLQSLLGIDADGVFGADTENAVRAFQASHNLLVDGIVGSHTWGLLQDSSPIKIANPVTVVTQDALNDILQAAASSSLAGVNWRDRGRAPIGYIKGMAATYGRVYAKWKAKDSSAIVMAAMNSGKDETDALSWYNSQFRAAGMDNSLSGPATLRHLFVLLIGLGMRESSGHYFEGRDVTVPMEKMNANSAEAGLFQMSWDSHGASPEIPRLFAQYTAKPDGFLSIFQEGIGARDSETVGSGDGAAFQRLCKACPAFAVEAAAVGLRVVRRLWGPIIRHEAEIRPEADALLQQVEKIVDAKGVVVVQPGDGGVVLPPSRPLDLIQMLVLIVLMTLLKEKQMAGDPSKQGQADPLMVILPTLLQSLTSGKQPNFNDLVTGLLSGMAAPAPATPATPAPTTPAPLSTDPLASILLPLLLARLGVPIGTTPIATTPTPTTPAATDPLSVIKNLLDGLKGVVPSGSSTPAPTTAPDQQQIQKILDLLKAVLGNQGLGPVNGALGGTIGNLLDGKKSAIGIIGSVLSGVMATSTTTSAASVLPSILGTSTLIPGIGQIALPIFLGMTIWGALGKMEKWNGQSK